MPSSIWYGESKAELVSTVDAATASIALAVEPAATPVLGAVDKEQEAQGTLRMECESDQPSDGTSPLEPPTPVPA